MALHGAPRVAHAVPWGARGSHRGLSVDGSKARRGSSPGKAGTGCA